jgi:hypothetical protein
MRDESCAHFLKQRQRESPCHGLSRFERKLRKMTSPYESDGKESAAEMLMALLADVSDQALVMVDELRTKPGVKNASRGCDVRKISDDSRFGGRTYYGFEAYIEAELKDGSVLCWLVDINCTPSGWEMTRAVRLTRSSGQEVSRFPAVRAASFAEFAGKVTDAMAELVRAARSYSS